MTPVSKTQKHEHEKDQVELPGIVYIIAFLIGVLIFLLFGGSLFGVKPDPFWIAGLMGLSVAAIAFWVWSEIRKN
jgi:hypothetical protein